MQTQQYQININAPAKKVWFALWNLYYYQQWTSVFSEGSYVKTNNWEQGSRVHFLTPAGEGMYSEVTLNIPNQAMNFNHLGTIKNFEEQSIGENVENCAGSRENYTLKEQNEQTTLSVLIEIEGKYSDFFNQTFPKGLAIVKQIAENFYIPTQVDVDALIETVWQNWTQPSAIIQWNHASDDWHTTRAENDLQVGGKYLSRMEAKDGSMGFDLEGTYTAVVPYQLIEHCLADNRKVKIMFEQRNNQIQITQMFEPENTNSYELQQNGWQAILNNFKKFTTTQ